MPTERIIDEKETGWIWDYLNDRRQNEITLQGLNEASLKLLSGQVLSGWRQVGDLFFRQIGFAIGTDKKNRIGIGHGIDEVGKRRPAIYVNFVMRIDKKDDRTWQYFFKQALAQKGIWFDANEVEFELDELSETDQYIAVSAQAIIILKGQSLGEICYGKTWSM